MSSNKTVKKKINLTYGIALWQHAVKYVREIFHWSHPSYNESQVHEDVLDMHQLQMVRDATAKMEREQSDIDLLVSVTSNIKFFETLDTEVVKRVCGKLNLQRYGKGHPVFVQGSVGEEFFIVMRGIVSLFVNENPIVALGAGSSFGELALMHNQPRSGTIVCATECELLTVSKQDYQSTLQAIQQEQTEQKKRFLQSVSVFQNWPGSAIDIVQYSFRPQQYERGAPIIRTGDPPRALLLVLSGTCTIFKELMLDVPRKRIRVAISDVGSGEFLSISPVLLRGKENISVIARTAVELYAVKDQEMFKYFGGGTLAKLRELHNHKLHLRNSALHAAVAKLHSEGWCPKRGQVQEVSDVPVTKAQLAKSLSNLPKSFYPEGFSSKKLPSHWRTIMQEDASNADSDKDKQEHAKEFKGSLHKWSNGLSERLLELSEPKEGRGVFGQMVAPLPPEDEKPLRAAYVSQLLPQKEGVCFPLDVRLNKNVNNSAQEHSQNSLLNNEQRDGKNGEANGPGYPEWRHVVRTPWSYSADGDRTQAAPVDGQAPKTLPASRPSSRIQRTILGRRTPLFSPEPQEAPKAQEVKPTKKLNKATAAEMVSKRSIKLVPLYGRRAKASS